MPRMMSDNGEAFRAVIVSTTTHADGRVTSHTRYEGPYANVGAAKSRITWAKKGERRYRNAWDNSETVMVGHVERTSTNWEPVAAPPSPPTVTVPESTFESLKEDSRFLSALRAAGVDNWEGYSFAFDDEDDEDAE